MSNHIQLEGPKGNLVEEIKERLQEEKKKWAERCHDPSSTWVCSSHHSAAPLSRWLQHRQPFLGSEEKAAYPAIFESRWETHLTLTGASRRLEARYHKYLQFGFNSNYHKLFEGSPGTDTISSTKLYAKPKKYVILDTSTHTAPICQKRDNHTCLQLPNREANSEKCLVTLS